MHGSHSHAPGQAHTSRHDTNERRMGLAALLLGFMNVESPASARRSLSAAKSDSDM
jgi:hypothetical protein